MILLLGGTGAARRLAQDLTAWLPSELPLIASLSGATKSPEVYPCETRTGGFGGRDAMADWIRRHDVRAVIDATHPYAARISANAVHAAKTTGVPIVTLDRPPWSPRSDDDWRAHPDLATAVEALPTGARAFFATGRGGVDIIKERTDIWSALRVVDDPKARFPGNGEYIVARPPFDVDAEKALFTLLAITHVVAKNAGDDAARTKLDAAAALGLPVFMIERPDGPRAPALPADRVLAWLEAQLKAAHAAKPSPGAASGA